MSVARAAPAPGAGETAARPLLGGGRKDRRPGAGGVLAAALPGALVPELLWAHYMPALSVDGEQK